MANVNIKRLLVKLIIYHGNCGYFLKGKRDIVMNNIRLNPNEGSSLRGAPAKNMPG
jgi:hypothetical protein